MADVGREQHLVVALAGEEGLGVRDVPVLERRVDHHLVLLVGPDLLPLALRHAEAPGVGPVRGSVGNPVGVLRERMEPAVQLGAAQRRPDRAAVAEDVQVARPVVDDPGAARVGNPRVGDVPLPRDGPVEDGRPGRHLRHLERHELPHDAQRLADAVAGQAAWQREELARELEGLGAGRGRVEPVRQRARTSFLHRKASAKRVGEFASMPRSRISPRNKSSVNQCLSRWEGKCSSRSSTLRCTTASERGT